MLEREAIIMTLALLSLTAVLAAPFYIIHLIVSRFGRRSKRRSAPKVHHSRADRQPPANHKLTKRERHPMAPKLKAMLLTLYEPKYDFLVGVSTLRPTSRMGFYTTRDYYRMTIHSGWNSNIDTSIHEFAHHIAITELPRRVRTHGREFKTIYSILIDCYNSHYPYEYPDSRYYLEPHKRVKDITLNVK